MDRQQIELFLILIGMVAFLLGGILAWLIFPWLSREQLVIAIAVAALLLIIAGFGLSLFFHSYIITPRRFAGELKVIMTANPAHRVKAEGGATMKELAQAINSFADRFQTTLDNQAVQIQQAKTGLEEEKNRLAALMSELTEGVLVCNLEGRILLYNNRAKQLLGHRSGGGPFANTGGGFVGLGRSIFALVDRNAITHALDNLAYHKEKDSDNLVSNFVTTATNGQLVRTHMAPVLTGQGEINGFVLTLEDITRQSETSMRRDMLLRTLTEGVRSSLANIRAAIETIAQYPEMDSDKLDQLRNIIYEESLTLSSKLNEATEEYALDLKTAWQLEDILDTDLLWAIQRRFEEKLDIAINVNSPPDNLWVRVDSYSVVHAMTYIMRRLKEEFNVDQAELCLKKTGHLAALDLSWRNGIVDMDVLWSWQNERMTINGDDSSLTLRDVAEHHGGEIWCQADEDTNTAYFRFLLPTTRAKQVRTVQVVQHSRPEYYDFDLFHQPGQTPEMDNRYLTEITHTVFDTETTGLNPAKGDEIISVSAVRIVNGRLLRQEVFDQLVDPKRSLPWSSTEITGISPEMVKGQPTIEQVLPVFHKFAEGTVLVAHNAAFDMRLLQLKEAKTGVKFTNPVLDTLLLSAVVYPNYKDHSLETIASRLGINVIGRHTSLGDAIVTGEVFLKLIPVLHEKGIFTLADARNAAQETYFARLKY